MDFTEIASKRFQQNIPFVKEHLGRLISRLPASVAEDYLESNEKTSNGPMTFMRSMMYHFCLYSGFLQANVTLSGESLFTFGAKIIPWKDILPEPLRSVPFADSCQLDYLQEKRILPHNQGTIEMHAILPSEIRTAAETLLSKDIMPFLRNYYAYQPAVRDMRYQDLFFLNAEERIKEIVHQAVLHKTNVCFSHLRFQDVRTYFEILGEHKSMETINMIYNTIKGNIKEKDSIFILSPVSYLVVSANSEPKVISSRFSGVYFHVSNVIIDYDLFQKTISQEPDDYFTLWQELRI